MASSSASVKLSSPSPFESGGSDVDRSAHYGGLVGDIWTEIEMRMAPGAAAPDTPLASVSNADYVHMLSVACGYVGLLLGFVAAVAASAFLIL